ncbi:MAG: branched-chain amino acid transport system ATP-binding protein livF [Actinomycetota bacterium]|jgi:branched-chain amino acid transport system ATP-binding protein
MAALLEATDVDVHYGRVQVLFGVSIAVEEGEFLALLGTNGAGKSTFLKAVSNLSAVTGGRVVFAGEDITNLPPDKIAAKGLAHVPGGRGTLPDLTVEENLRLGGHLLRHDKAAFAEGLDRAMALFPWMGERRRQLAGTLSGGEQQMLAIARALVLRPTMLMVDELSLGLAPVIVEELMGVLQQLNAEGITVLVVEQHATLAMQVSERVLFMEKGQVRFSGAGKDLLGRDDLLRSVFLGA